MTQCGIFSQIKKKDGSLNHVNIKLYDSARVGDPISSLFETFDCEKGPKTFATKDEEPWISFTLVKRKLNMLGFLYSRIGATYYPKSIEILGRNEGDWERIYINEKVAIAEGGTGNFSFNNNKFYSSFMFKQLANSYGVKYLEAYKIDFFGILKRDYWQITCKSYIRYHNVIYISVIIFLYSI